MFLTVGWTGRVAIIVTAMWLGLTVLLAFRTSEVPHRLMLVVRGAVAAIVVAAVAVAFGGGNRAYGTIVILWSLLVLASPIAIGWRVLHHRRVTTQTVLGALCIYVLIGLVFANFDYGVPDWSRGTRSLHSRGNMAPPTSLTSATSPWPPSGTGICRRRRAFPAPTRSSRP